MMMMMMTTTTITIKMTTITIKMTTTSHLHSTRTQTTIYVLLSYAAHPIVVLLQVDLTNMCRAALGLW
jgi:uncharacterized RmlC-like cupin family protein